MSLSRNSNTIGDLTKAAKKRSKMPEISSENETVQVEEKKEPTINVDQINKAKEDIVEVATSKSVIDEDISVNTTDTQELVVPPRSQVRVSAYSMAKIRAIMEIKDIQFSHEVINYILDVAEEAIFTDIEKTLYDAQMEFQRLKFEENGWDTER